MFVGRETELKQLKAVGENIEPKVAVVYGRRRIGKTELIRHAFKDKKVFSFEGLENQGKKEQIKNFIFQLSKQCNINKVHNINNWRDAFYLLFDQVKKKNGIIIVLDEFQWLANYRQDVVSDLKMIWEQYLSQIPGITLILCGSIASFMLSKVIKSNAFYGRTDLIINLKEFSLFETAKMLKNKGQSEIIEARLFLGGVPKYLELVRDKPSIRIGIEELAFKKNGYFVDEYDRIFTSHFGKNPDYKKIIAILSKFNYGIPRKIIAQKGNVQPGGELSNHLLNLESAGFISSNTPFNKNNNSRLIRYKINDAYMHFYFSFIAPNLKKIHTNNKKNIFAAITQTGLFFSWIGCAFERMCIDHADIISKILGFNGIDFIYGPYFERATNLNSGTQIDLVFNRADNVLTLCEMKYGLKPIGTSIIAEVEKKSQILQNKFPKKTIQKVLIINGNVTKNLIAKGYFYKIIKTKELIIGGQ